VLNATLEGHQISIGKCSSENKDGIKIIADWHEDSIHCGSFQRASNDPEANVLRRTAENSFEFSTFIL
jgi:hypothetical protein